MYILEQGEALADLGPNDRYFFNDDRQVMILVVEEDGKGEDYQIAQCDDMESARHMTNALNSTGKRWFLTDAEWNKRQSAAESRQLVGA